MIILRNWTPSSHPFQFTSMSLFRQYAFFGSFRRFLFDAWFWRFGCFLDKFDQAIHSVLPVAILRSKSSGLDNEASVLRHFVAGNTNQTGANSVGKRRRIFDIKTKLHSCRHFIDILSSRPWRSDEAQFDLIFMNGNGGGDAYHTGSLHQTSFFLKNKKIESLKHCVKISLPREFG